MLNVKKIYKIDYHELLILNSLKKGKEQLKNEKIYVIYSSPLKRAIETDQSIAKYSNIKIYI